MEKDIIKNNKIRCIISLILCLLIVITTFIGMIIRFFYQPNVLEGTNGINSFRLFTVLSNLLVATVSLISIPYTIDGLKNNNYHLPRWICDALFVGVNATTITFIIALCLISVTSGLRYAMLDGTDLFFHTIVPLLALIMFIFSNSYHHLSIKKSLIAFIPPFLYATIYCIMVFGIKEENGGWPDFYSTSAYLPWYISIFLIMVIFFCISELLRLAHNIAHSKQKENIINYYLTNKKYECDDITKAIKILANENKKNDSNGDLYIPRRIIKWLMQRYNAKENLAYYINIYVNEFLKEDL